MSAIRIEASSGKFALIDFASGVQQDREEQGEAGVAQGLWNSF